MKLAVLLLVLSSSVTHAFNETCTCLSYVPENASPERKVKYELKRSKAVFSGEVLQIDKRQAEPFKGYLEITFKVKVSWKRVKVRTVSVITAAPISLTTSHQINCGYPFQKGESYLVYVENTSGNIMLTGTCSRTKRLADATEDLKILGKGILKLSSADK